jgi:hypothetical protein
MLRRAAGLTDMSEKTSVPVKGQLLGKKQANLLTAIMRGVPVLGRGKDFHALTDGDIRSALSTLPAGTDVSQTGELNRLRPRLRDTVIGARTRQACYLRGLPSHDLEPLLRTVGARGVAGSATARVARPRRLTRGARESHRRGRSAGSSSSWPRR